MFLTRQHGDADGAPPAERLHGGMLGHAGVLSFVLGTHLLQRQLGGRQDPVVTLRERESDGDTQQSVGESDKREAGQVEQIFLIDRTAASRGSTKSDKLQLY